VTSEREVRWASSLRSCKSSFPIPLRVGGWVGLSGLLKCRGGLPAQRRSPIPVPAAAAENLLTSNLYMPAVHGWLVGWSLSSLVGTDTAIWWQWQTLKKPAPETCTSFWYRIEHVLSDTRIWYQKKSMQDCTSVPVFLVAYQFLVQVSWATVTGVRDEPAVS